MTDTKQTMWIRSVPTDLARKIRAGAALHGLTLAQWMAEAYDSWLRDDAIEGCFRCGKPITYDLYCAEHQVVIRHDIVEGEQK